MTKISDDLGADPVEAQSDENIDDTDMIFRYQRLLRFYRYRWRTRDETQGTYNLRVDLGDGVLHDVNVSLRRW